METLLGKTKVIETDVVDSTIWRNFRKFFWNLSEIREKLWRNIKKTSKKHRKNLIQTFKILSIETLWNF